MKGRDRKRRRGREAGRERLRARACVRRAWGIPTVGNDTARAGHIQWSSLSLSLSVVSHVNRDSTGTALLGLPRRIAASITIKSTHHPPFTRWLVISQSPASSHSQPLTQKAHVLARWTLWTRFASSFSDWGVGVLRASRAP